MDDFARAGLDWEIRALYAIEYPAHQPYIEAFGVDYALPAHLAAYDVARPFRIGKREMHSDDCAAVLRHLRVADYVHMVRAVDPGHGAQDLQKDFEAACLGAGGSLDPNALAWRESLRILVEYGPDVGVAMAREEVFCHLRI